MHPFHFTRVFFKVVLAAVLAVLLFPFGLGILRVAGCVHTRATAYEGMTNSDTKYYSRQNHLIFNSLSLPEGAILQRMEHFESKNGGDGEGVTVGISNIWTFRLPPITDDRALVKSWQSHMWTRGWRTSTLTTAAADDPSQLIWAVKAYKGSAQVDLGLSGRDLRVTVDFRATAPKPPFPRCY